MSDAKSWPAGLLAGPADDTLSRALASAAAVAAFVLLPLVMTVANKSSPLLLGVAAALANLSALRSGRGPKLLQGYIDLARSGSGLCVLAGIALAIGSLAWSTDPAMSFRGLREALPEVVFAWSFAAAGRLVLRRGDVALLRYGLVLASLEIGTEAVLGMPLHHLVGARAESYDLKWSALTLALLVWPAIGDDVQRDAWTWPLAVVLSTLAAALAAHSSTAVCAIAISALLFGAACWTPRVTLAALVVVLFAALIVPPWFGRMAGDMVSPRLRTVLEQQHAEHRIEIWTDFGKRIGERFWLGHGFNTSFGIGRRDVPDEAPIVASHPHNTLLQVWVEFGLVGVLGVGTAMAYLVGRLRALTVSARAVRMAQLGTVMVLGLVWQNPWRPWWLAALGLAMAVFVVERVRADKASVSDQTLDHPAR